MVCTHWCVWLNLLVPGLHGGEWRTGDSSWHVEDPQCLFMIWQVLSEIKFAQPLAWNEQTENFKRARIAVCIENKLSFHWKGYAIINCLLKCRLRSERSFERFKKVYTLNLIGTYAPRLFWSMLYAELEGRKSAIEIKYKPIFSRCWGKQFAW